MCVEDSLAIGRTKPVHKLLHPPANMPYVALNTITPATVCPATPQRTKVERDVAARVISPRGQGETWDTPLGDLPEIAYHSGTRARAKSSRRTR